MNATLLTPILIDTAYSKYLNNSNLCVIPNSNINTSSHSYFSALSFTKYNFNLSIIQSSLSEKSLLKILEYLLILEIKNPIFLPFGSSAISPKISTLLNYFDINQVFCSFNNISDKKNFPSVHKNVTAVSSINFNNEFYFKKCDSDILWYKKINPIKIKQKTLNYNSFVLGDLYYALVNKLEINKQKEIIMPKWNFDNNYTFQVKKHELFGFKITESNSLINSTADSVFYDDGFIYGSVDEPLSFSIQIEEETRNFTIDPVKDDNYQFSILAKKF